MIGKISKKVIQNADSLKVIGRHGVGIDNVDLQAATERRIPVVYTPEANTESVADHTIGLMLAVAKNTPGTLCSQRKQQLVGKVRVYRN